MPAKRGSRWLRRLLFLAVVAAVLGVWLVRKRGAGPPSRPLADLAREIESRRRQDLLSRQVIPPTDLPPQGTRSLFDHLIKEAGALPYPFERLVDLVASYDREGKKPVALLVPDGRSLLKAQATFEKPRVVVAASSRIADSDSDLGMHLGARLFLGFVEDANEIEVISYNEEAGRFEFQLVSDYREGGIPTLAYARRSLCVTCHQAEAPIFPERPWQETNAEPRIARRILDARAVPAAERGRASYRGVPIVVPLAAAEAFDDLVQTANVLPTAQSIFIDGCGGDPANGVECRRRMLSLSLQSLWNLQPDPAETGALLELQRKSWPAGGIAVPNSSLPNRDPPADSASGPGLGARLARLFGRDSVPEDDSLPPSVRAFQKAPPPRPELDPLTPRGPRRILDATTQEGVFGVAQLFSPNDARLLEKQSQGDVGRLGRALSSRDAIVILAARPLRRRATVRTLLAGLGGESPPRSSGESDEGMSAPTVAGAKPLEIAKGSPLEPFERHCFACHRGNPAARLDLMTGDTEEEVLARLKQVGKIREVLDFERYLGTSKEATLMPPRGSYQREALDRARSEGRDDVARMVGVMPDAPAF